MTDNLSNNIEHRHHGVLTWLLLPIALFPLVALLTYDWHAVTALCSPPAPSTNWVGTLGDGFAYYGYLLLGLAVWLIPVFCIASGIAAITGRRTGSGHRKAWSLVLLLSTSCILQVLGSHAGVLAEITRRINTPNPGGAVGYLAMTRLLCPLISDFGSAVLMAVVILASLIAVIGPHNLAASLSAVAKWATEGAPRRKGSDDEPDAFRDANADRAADEPDPYEAIRAAKAAAKRMREEEKAAAKAEKIAAKQAAKEAKAAAKIAEREAKAALRDAARTGGTPPSPSETAPGEPESKGPYLLPSVALLNPLKKSTADHGDVGEMSKRLVDTLKIFGIDATLAYTVQGPVVTKYALALEPGTRYSAVTNISDNLMGALHAKSLRIEAPIPGEDHVGIEVPNRAPAGISFREIIESDAWKGFKGELPLLFGKDAAGRELIADLASMPHMLVAGATGQGKSVCLNSIINGLLMTKTPAQLKLIMVDPKSVEFTSYVSIPHLIVPIITENKKVVFALHWAVAEMEKRLKLFARARVRNIHDFNHRPSFTQTDMFGADAAVGSDMPKTVPYIVIIIDEVADLMASSAKEVTPDIARLTAKARAAGIHLILATQRPDAKVITGTIKANVPGRVAFKTATGIDSRTILDEGGAENLIGRGDMLFKSKDGLLIRAQGAWISDPEIAHITQFIEQHSNTDFDDRFTKKLSTIKEAEVDIFAEDESGAPSPEDAQAARDQVKAEENASDFKKAVECIINTNRASTSHFQRKLGWGYNHSAKIMDMLEDAGVIGPQSGAGPRQIIMGQEELLQVFNGGDASAPRAEGTGIADGTDLDNTFTEEQS